MATLSLVVPVYNEQEAIPLFFEALEQVKTKIENFNFEYWFIDDGSTDNTIQTIKELNIKYDYVHFIEFSRNFGKEAALYAGLEHTTGDYIAVMDVDLQDPPALLPEMLDGVLSGEYDAVGTRRVNRDGEPPIRSFFSSLFYKIINKISDTYIVEGARDYRVMSRQMVESILSLQEYNRFSKGIFAWIGFKQKYIEYKNVDRVAGSTSWSFWKLLKYSIEGIVSFSQAPLLISFFMGFISFLIAIIFIVILIVRHFIDPGSAINGWTSMVVIILMVSGVQLLSLGIIGRYISNIYMEVKKRPIYLARKIK
ncbi:glycosyltransferase family 2 protein [Weissella koreensis]|uniref:Glycosyltransferase family 2 protein n=1 Tax=Weissella koreensis TaxID=165096 RepID=A0A7H1MM15_9LACO|nr:glycosyltransferase family 2 protein [Weissella koreensis]EJF33333.1 undecaprenyl phosphate 4-deoxy-4-formamido-L-arabinose transferase [Weissella koreensis KCTC 3621]QGN20523.1 glycosyltransferase [Weissella koreensis]QNT64501.1 glycosyltransferase family 2 protein [Weissella koreensis]